MAISDELFKTALAEAETLLNRLLTEQATIEQRHSEIDIEIAKLTEKIGHLAALANEPGFKGRFLRVGREAGLNTTLIQVLQAADSPLTVAEIKDRLESRGVDAKQPNNFLATLHMMLKRMAENDQVIPSTNEKGRKVYKWNPDYSPLRVTFDADLLRKALKPIKTRRVPTLEDSQANRGVPEPPIFVNYADPEEVKKLKKS